MGFLMANLPPRNVADFARRLARASSLARYCSNLQPITEAAELAALTSVAGQVEPLRLATT